MKSIFKFVFIILLCIGPLFAQSNFSIEGYTQFLENHQDLSFQNIYSDFPPPQTYYSDRVTSSLQQYTYLDSISKLYSITDDEHHLLEKYHFFVSERLSFDSFGEALHDIYSKDMPVMVTSDAILHALHYSYDQILFYVEKTFLTNQLNQLLNTLWDKFPDIYSLYENDSLLVKPLNDVDLYLTIAKSLYEEELLTARYANQSHVKAIWDAIEAEQMVTMPLFSDPGKRRYLDFSQFTVRGHYTRTFWDEGEEQTLDYYFQTMMWLGRADFWFNAPPSVDDAWTVKDMQRMVFGASLLNELLTLANTNDILNTFETILQFLVGESDNLTPFEYVDVWNTLQIEQTSDLLSDSVYAQLIDVLTHSQNASQRILSNVFIYDPFLTEVPELPVSYRLIGQRFVFDSYIFGSLVFPHIQFQNQQIWRPLPDPLDILFVLGNDNALPLLENEINTYHYASQINALRYLSDAYDDSFWEVSLYNTWLNAIRALNPDEQPDSLPYFMHTIAWQHEKINTQLASWSQLRHDNLLYAKQSYTGGTGCSYPYSYVEPYPLFFERIEQFADDAHQFFSGLDEMDSNYILYYFENLAEHMHKLKVIAEKETQRIPIDNLEADYLKKMLFISGMSGAPPFSGWYSSLFFVPDDAAVNDFIIADVHTQPTDQWGAMVGNILHVGTGKINLGVFLAEAPVEGYSKTAFVGPVMSYYEKVNSNFDRLTDERWTDLVEANNLPDRPDWVNVYLADHEGKQRTAGRMLLGTLYSAIDDEKISDPKEFFVNKNYPNPFNPRTCLSFYLPEKEHVSVTIYNAVGKQITILTDQAYQAGKHEIFWDAKDNPSGVYFVNVIAGSQIRTRKILLIK